MSNVHNLPRAERAARQAIVRVMWTDESGTDKFASVCSYDISELGIQLALPEPVPLRSYIVLQCTELGLQGTASVRSCCRAGMNFSVGLEFTGGMKWKAPQAACPLSASGS